ncbi:DUF4158 domain-containing protein [Actinoalloteichus fjordicus]|uniref:DUF4158 domain-containing protein n=1 Tax=Actinoalloteichus TaxID=65496 RepID=UPI00384FFA25
MCTVRYIGRFLPDDPRDAPWPVVEHQAAQLGIEDPSVVKRYTERPKTDEHAWEISFTASTLPAPCARCATRTRPSWTRTRPAGGESGPSLPAS